MRRTSIAAVVLALGLAFAAAGASGATAPSFFDSGFGHAGQAVLSTSSTYWETGVVQGDGKPVAVGSDGAHLLLARYTTSGTLDSTFSSGGVTATTAPGSQAIAYAVIPDGDQFLVAGTDVSSTTHSNEVLVARYDSDGSLDTTFGTNGFYTGNLPGVSGGDAGFALGLQSDGKIVVLVDNLDASSQQMWGLIRLSADGSLDTSFGTGGMFWTQTGGTDTAESYYAAYALLIEPNDEIVTAGENLHEMTLWELKADGSAFDSSFGAGGRAQGSAESGADNDVALAIVREADGSLVVGGGRGFSSFDTSDEAFALERFTSTGHLDGTFGSGGLVTTQLGSKDDEIEGLAQAPDGDLVAAGFSGFPDGDSWYEQFAAARYSQDGVLDTAFGKNGIAVTPGGGVWTGTAVDSDGRIYTFGTDGNSAVAARYLGGIRPLAMTPTTGVVGDVVHLTGPDMSADDQVTIGALTVPDADVTQISPTAIDVTIPPDAVSGKVSVVTPGGTATTSANLAVLADVTSLDAAGPFTAGQTVGIDGATFTGVKSVTVGGVAWKFRIDSDSHITATVPVTAVDGTLTIANAGGTTSAGTLDIAPVIAKFSPAAGAAGTSVTITGTGLNGAMAEIDGVGATVKSSAARKLVVLVPSTAATGTIAVSGAGGGAATTLTSFRPLPRITSIAPGRRGQVVHITGTNLGGASTVKFGTVIVSATVNSPTDVSVTIPAGNGTAKWTLVTPSGTATSANYEPAPTISSFTPTSGPVKTVVTVSGTDFAGAKSVTVNGIRAKFSVSGGIRIKVTVPAGATTGAIAVQTAGGTTASSTDFTVTA